MFAGNLDASAADGEQFVATAYVVDSLGAEHPVDFWFVKVPGSNAWDWVATSSDQTISLDSWFGVGTLSFDASGAAETDPLGPEGELDLSFTNGAESRTWPNAIPIEMDDLLGLVQPSAVDATAS